MIKYKKILFILLLIYYILLNLNNYKICLCTSAKYEKKYIIEFIEHYKKYGVDKIFLYDNNDINGENYDFLSNYIKSNFVEIIDYRGKKNYQFKIYQNCYNNNYKTYKWLIFYDIDEYIFLNNYSSIHDYLSQYKFIKCDSIYLNWVLHTDNDLLFYDNRTLIERFPKVMKNQAFCLGKSIIKGNLKNVKISSSHILDMKLKMCDGFGNFFTTNSRNCKVPDYKYNYIDHYQYKSTQEFIEKLNFKGDGIFINNNRLKYRKIIDYFKVNTINSDKINYICNYTGFNATFIKEQLIKYNT